LPPPPQGLVDLGFKLATGQVEALKPGGVRLLTRLVHFFGRVADPMVDGALLLEQYQAQYVSALRAALLPGAAPQLSIAGGVLATTVLESGLAAGDVSVMRRLMELLSQPLADWRSVAFQQYAEWVGVQSRVALLQAQAQCAAIPAGGGLDTSAQCVARAQAPYGDMLALLWAALLQVGGRGGRGGYCPGALVPWCPGLRPTRCP
jgi:hypothetical protein